MKHFYVIVFILTFSNVIGQITDDFSDGDFTANPAWMGTGSDYIVNTSFELQLNNTIASSSYLTTPHGLTTLDDKEWHLLVRQTFAPSGSNFGRVYLTASNADLTTDPDGFYLLFGEAGTNDAIRLFKVVSGLHTELLAGPLGQIAASFNVGVKVTRDNLANWNLYIDANGGTNYSLAGTINDGTILLGTHFGLYDIYTVSNATKFYYDDVYVGDIIVDTVPPVLLSASPVTATAVDVLFNESLDQTSAENISNYDIIPFNAVSNAVLDGIDPKLVHLTLTSAMANGNTYQLSTVNVADVSLNPSGNQSANFTYLLAETPSPGDVVINEFMCDPSPPLFLPELEFVEIYNISSKVFDISSWTLSDASSTGTIQSQWLLPGEYRVLTATSSVSLFTNSVGVTSFPSLNNAGDAIVLKSDTGLLMDSIYYSDAWYHDQTKADGGYSIERINPFDPCTDISDWTASNDPDGGSPGEQNSVYDPTPDTQEPFFNELFAMPPNQLSVSFNEGMDSLSLATVLISVTPALTVQSIEVYPTGSTSMLIVFNENLVPSQVYYLNLQGVADCWGNTTDLSGSFILPEAGEAGDLVINEILFDPVTGGSDWVELYNRSDKLIDLYNWQLGNNDNGILGNLSPITDHYLLSPDDYVVLTEDSLQILQYYPAAVPGKYYLMDLPTFNNDSSTVYLLQDNTIRDKVSYIEDWHFTLLDDTEGKSLERIDPSESSDDPKNWHTAAEAIGFATPGRVNSQYSESVTNGDFSYTNETISPDNDGFEDVLQVNYELLEGGLIGTFKVYDDRGRFIAEIMHNELLAMKGSFTWDGITDDGTKASIGTYVGVFEAFAINGGLMFTKTKAFTVAGKL